jgi:hypothetical protein
MVMMDVESLETLSTMLGVKSRIIEADIKDLAWVWEETLSQARFADPRLAFYVLRALSRSYLRGRDLRMGNHQGLRRHEVTEAKLMRILVGYAAGEIIFGCLHEVGVISLQSFIVALNSYADIADEVNDTLQEEQNDERE